MMQTDEFIHRAIGARWVRWQSSWESMDCYGLLVLYHREVLGIELEGVQWTDKAEAFGSQKCWQECAPEPGATCWMSWRNGAPVHCGILLPGSMVLHSEGSDEHPGSVRVTRLATVMRAYGEIRHYRYMPTLQ